jgi:tetratricopeptide (TPR) repeat protein
MTKISIALLLFFYSISSMGQSLDDINQMMDKQKFKEAKTGIDAFLANPKNAAKSDGWYYKGRIYNSLSYDKTILPADAYDLKITAFEAFQKNQELDSKDIRLKVEEYKSYLDLYYAFFDLGASFYNTKEFEKAYNSFSKAITVKDFILNKKYSYTGVTLYPLDTALVLNTAIAAMQSKNEEGTIANYKKLTDASVGGPTYQEVYEYLADHYSKKGDEVNLKDILDKGRKLYPKSEYWSSLELDAVRKKGDQALLFAKYEQMIKEDPSNFIVPYNYAIELFNTVYGQHTTTTDAKAAKEKITQVLKGAIANDKGIEGVVLMTKHLYNMSSDLSIAANLVKGNKPEDVKKKADLVVQTKKQMDEFLEYAKIASAHYDTMQTLKPVQKATYQELLTNMSEVYNYKKDVKLAAEADKKKAAL